MDREEQRWVAVVMGDLVRSEQVRDTERLHLSFNKAVDRCNREHKVSLRSPLTITLGDEFQGIAASLSAAVPLVRALRFALMADEVECRFAVGIAELKTPINDRRAWNMMGPGLASTRRKLNEKGRVSLYRFAVTDDPVIAVALEAIGAALTSIERRWTDRQREDIVLSLAGRTAKDIAADRGVSVHSIYKVRAAGDFDAYALQWRAVEQVLGSIDLERGLTR